MATITLRNTKGTPLTNTEVDNNFQNLNNAFGANGSSTIPTPTGTVNGTTSVPVLSLSPTITTPTIAGGSLTAITGFGIRDTSAAYDVTVAATSSTALTAGRILSLDVVNAARSIKLAGNIDIAGNLTTAGAFTTSGAYSVTFTSTATTSLTLPTTGTLATLAGSETFTNKTITSPTISTNLFGGTQANLTRFPLAFASISNVTTGAQSETIYAIGLLAEAPGHASTVGQYGVGLYGVGYTSNINRGIGVQGEGHVSASTDNANAVGVRGYANDTRTGGSTGLNIGLYADATGSLVNNYALYMNTGNIYSGATQTWTIQSGGLTITGGPVSFGTALAITSGGTGATTVTAAQTNLQVDPSGTATAMAIALG